MTEIRPPSLDRSSRVEGGPDLDRNVMLRGERELAERAGHLFHGARREFVCAATTLRTWPVPGEPGPLRSDVSGPVVRKLFSPLALADEESERHLAEVAAHGVQVRICTSRPPHETIIVDGRVAILAGPRDQGVRTYTVVRSAEVVGGIASLFRTAWDAATDLADFRRDRHPALTSDHRRILAMLAAGQKDEAAARELGVSLRTYRRRVAELMRLLGARSRFEAGLRAGGLT
ncbi:hypothetical protein Sru01_69500 [Sphaerisporangium rufum]|uniref:HTH luxR-type domain-containing protein n=1 Tax=Sphaerisporangium rufum TaxID=1381558 RepID=A0A919RA23_9ACTN|nr:helix-turn-helix transcriptional regulator [Sphaerisporangium rufum]GII81968.1 hypothetical protein Sru01_69500 [Sphaerisporangium rufum]